MKKPSVLPKFNEKQGKGATHHEHRNFSIYRQRDPVVHQRNGDQQSRTAKAEGKNGEISVPDRTMKEYPEERMLVEHLWKTFGKDWVCMKEIAEFDGCSTRTVKRRYNIGSTGMSIFTLAHMKCQLSRKN